MALICRDRPTFGFEEYLILFNQLIEDENKIEKFENEFAGYVGARHALTFSSARIGLYCIYKSLGIRNKEIIVPAYICVPVPDSVIWSENIPKFVDINLNTYNINESLIEKNINENTGAIVCAHLYGLPCNMDTMLELRERYGIPIIEDSAIALGAKYNGRKVGSIGDAAIFSLERSKIITSYKGGIVTTNSEELYQELYKMREEFKNRHLGFVNILRALAYHIVTQKSIWGKLYPLWRMQSKGPSSMMGRSEEELPEKYLVKYTPIQATLARKQLKKVEELLKRRRENAEFLTRNLSNIEAISIPCESERTKHVYGRYTIRIDTNKVGRDRMEIHDKLRKKGVDTGLLYTYVCPLTDFYKKKFNLPAELFPNSIKASNTILNLPVYPSLNKDDLLKIVNTILEVVRA